MHASVIVPSYNSRTTIGHCLRAVRDQKTAHSYEIVVVDSSNDGTGDLIESGFPRVKLIRIPQRTLPGLARNLGIEVSQGEILAFTDADCIPEPLWLNKMIRQHEIGGYAAVGGSVLNGLPFHPVAWAGYLLEFSERLPKLPKREVDLLPTCNVSVHRSAFERHGLFPTNLWPSEDHIFSWKLIRGGESLLFDPGIHVRHIFRTKLSSFIQHQIRLGRASASARRQVDLPHRWLADHPLRFFVSMLRLIVIEARLGRWDPVNFIRFNILLPLCLSGLIAWGIGFCFDQESPEGLASPLA